MLFSFLFTASRSLPQNKNNNKKIVKKKRPYVPLQCLEKALQQCNRFLQQKEHDDIDSMTDVSYTCPDKKPDFRQYASRVPCPWGLTVVYKYSTPLNLASRDIACTEWNRQ